jgi:hypothetical protein
VAEIARAARDGGAAEIALADTIGVGVPAPVRDLVHRAREAAPARRCTATSTTPQHRLRQRVRRGRGVRRVAGRQYRRVRRGGHGHRAWLGRRLGKTRPRCWAGGPVSRRYGWGLIEPNGPGVPSGPRRLLSGIRAGRPGAGEDVKVQVRMNGSGHVLACPGLPARKGSILDTHPMGSLHAGPSERQDCLKSRGSVTSSRRRAVRARATVSQRTGAMFPARSSRSAGHPDASARSRRFLNNRRGDPFAQSDGRPAITSRSSSSPPVLTSHGLRTGRRRSRVDAAPTPVRTIAQLTFTAPRTE